MQITRYRKIAGLFTLYLFFFSLVTAFLFVTGNFQSFLENTNRLLLDILEWVLYLFLITDLYYIVFFILDLCFPRKHEGGRRGVFGLVWAGAGFLYGSGLLLLINLIFAWL